MSREPHRRKKGRAAAGWSGRAASRRAARLPSVPTPDRRGDLGGDGLFRTVFENSPIGMMFVGLDGRIEEANDAFLAMVGYGRGDVARGELRWDELTPHEYAERDAVAVEELRRLGACRPFDKEYVRKDGSRMAIVIAAALVGRDRERCLTFVIDDDERKRLERERAGQAEALSRSERLSALGTLVAGVAHEINNPLTYIQGNIELALLDVREAAARLPADAALDLQATARGLESALGGAERIGQITRALKAVARQRDAQDREVVDVGAVLADAGALLQVATPDTLTLTVDRPASPVLVLANVSELHQVILNLTRNAVEAVGDRPDASVRLAAAREGDLVTIRVEDNGPGIPPEVLARLFTPFFTTKPQGTGLGLSIVHGIVKDHGGDISVVSDPRTGTTFSVHLPVHQGPRTLLADGRVTK